MTFLHKEECPSCGSKNNLARYEDGGAHCFGSGCNYKEYSGTPASSVKKKKPQALVPLGAFITLKKRGISDITCHKMKYSVGEYNGVTGAHIVNVPDQDGNTVAQKIRMPNKEFRFIGDTANAGLVFQDIWPAASSKKIVICEGELDALSISQVQENRYAVVSLPNGASSALKACTKSYEYLNSFNEIIVLMDDDEAGREASKEVSKLFGSKAKLATIAGHKDASDALMAGEGNKIVSAIFDALPYRPDGVVTLSSLADTLDDEVIDGLPWIYENLTEATYGRRPGELYFIGAGSGVGKTDFFLQQMVSDLNAGEVCAAFLLEQPVNESAKRLGGKYVSKRLHVPDASWTQEDIDKAKVHLKSSNCYLYNHFGSKDWDTIKGTIRWLNVSEGTQHFYIDHLTALTAHEEDERRALERITAEMSSLAQELSINMYVISHLTTPDGKPHEEGGRVMGKHLKGSRSILYWAHFIFGLERDTQAEDVEVRTTTTFRVLKDRYTGRANGLTFHLGYEDESGLLYEQPKGWVVPGSDEGKQYGDY